MRVRAGQPEVDDGVCPELVEPCSSCGDVVRETLLDDVASEPRGIVAEQ